MTGVGSAWYLVMAVFATERSGTHTLVRFRAPL
jgi:hypothetical protein